MPRTYADLLREARAQIREVTAAGGRRAAAPAARPSSTSARTSEWEQGHLPGAVHISKSYVEQQIEAARPGPRRARRPVLRRRRPLPVRGPDARSSSATRTSPRCPAASRRGSRPGCRGTSRSPSPPEQKQRYSRHLLIPEVGAEGQARLLDSKALLIGAGGLGAPAALYLAAAGVGTIGIVDFDVVDLSNLQRQILHTNDRVGERKVESARKTINALNPDVNVVDLRGDARRRQRRPDHRRLRRDPRRHRHVRDPLPPQRRGRRRRASRSSTPAVFRFEGQLTTFIPYEGPCYRCLYPTPPPPELAPGCSVAGVLGVVPGIMGMLQANEALKVLLGIGEHARRPAAALRRPRPTVHRAEAPPRPGLPGLLDRGASPPGPRAGRCRSRRSRRPAQDRVARRAVRPRRRGREHGLDPAGPPRPGRRRQGRSSSTARRSARSSTRSPSAVSRRSSASC